MWLRLLYLVNALAGSGADLPGPHLGVRERDKERGEREIKVWLRLLYLDNALPEAYSRADLPGPHLGVRERYKEREEEREGERDKYVALAPIPGQCTGRLWSQSSWSTPRSMGDG